MQTVSNRFHQLAHGDVIPIDKGITISFDKKYDEDIVYGEFDISTFDSESVFSPANDNPIQQWDKYEYKNYSNRIISMECSRKTEFPYSVQSAIADVTLSNYDDYFTPNSNSPIAQYLFSNRPARLYAGYKTAGLIQQIVGMTQSLPEIDNKSKTASFTIMDFLSEIFKLPLTETVAMKDAYTGEVIEEVLKQYGLLPSQYDIPRGANKIPFVFFERGQVRAGDALRDILEAERGHLWLSESGIIIFEPRTAQDKAPVMVFDKSNIIDISDTGDSEIINSVKIHTELREVQEFQSVFSKSSSSSIDTTFVIPANSLKIIEVNLQDPTYDFVNPTQGYASNISWFITTDTQGNEVPAGVLVTNSELKANTISLEFYNANNSTVYIEEMDIWGEPAKKYDEITFMADDPDSIDKYGLCEREIDNNYLGSIHNCRSLAQILIYEYSEPATIIKMQVKGDFSLQLGDMITINHDIYNGNYKITSISHRLPEYCEIEARRYPERNYGVFDISEFDDGSTFSP